MIPFQSVCIYILLRLISNLGFTPLEKKKTRKLGLLKTSGNETKECKYLKKKKQPILKRSLTVMTGVLWCFA